MWGRGTFPGRAGLCGIVVLRGWACVGPKSVCGGAVCVVSVEVVLEHWHRLCVCDCGGDVRVCGPCVGDGACARVVHALACCPGAEGMTGAAGVFSPRALGHVGDSARAGRGAAMAWAPGGQHPWHVPQVVAGAALGTSPPEAFGKWFCLFAFL